MDTLILMSIFIILGAYPVYWSVNLCKNEAGATLQYIHCTCSNVECTGVRSTFLCVHIHVHIHIVSI